MRVKNIHVDQSPLNQEKIRLSAEVIYDDPPEEREVYWFDIPKQYEASISTSGNPWISCLLPVAMKFGESLRIDAEVDQTHFQNTQKLMQVWKCWYPSLHMISLEANVVSHQNTFHPDKRLAFFSGGIDSAFTLWQHNAQSAKQEGHIDEIIMILGFDMPLKSREYFQRKFEKCQNVARQFSAELLSIDTNIRETRIQHTEWGYLTHGVALAAVALALEKRYREVLIPSTGGYGDLKPWGSHILTDYMFSTSKTEIVHDGPEFHREEKSEAILNSKALMDVMHVCNNSLTDENCGRCEKCLRTLAVYDILGELDRCMTFDLNTYHRSDIARILMRYNYVEYSWTLIRNLAVERNRADMVRLVDKAFHFSSKAQKQLTFINHLMQKRFCWRLSQFLRNRVMTEAII